jgi:hypothetical protein
MRSLERRVRALTISNIKQTTRCLTIIRHPDQTWEEAELRARADLRIDPDFGSRPGENLAVIRLSILAEPG